MLQKADAGLNNVLNGFAQRMIKAEADSSKNNENRNIYNEYDELRKKQALQSFQETCGMDKQYYGAKVDSKIFSESHQRILTDYVDKFNNKAGLFLVILGEVGTGKTYSACAVMNELQCGTYLDMPELRLKLNTADRYGAKENREMFLHRLAECKLLVLDEVGRFAGKQDEEQEVLFYLLNKRYANKRPTIICSNLTAQEFSAYIGQALTDRLKGRNVKLILEGNSLRGTENERN